MSPDTPAWQPIDPTDGTLPGPLDAVLTSSDSVAGCIVLLVSPEIDRRWGAEASLSVARGWARKGRSVLLADASLADPSLHEAVAGTNGEGVSDMLLYGASVRRVARSAGDGLLVAPAGTPVGDAAEVLAHPRWDGVIRGFHEAGALLLLHLAAGTRGAAALLDKAVGVIVLSEATTDVRAIAGPRADRVLAVLGPGAATEAGLHETLGADDEATPPPDVDIGARPEVGVTPQEPETIDPEAEWEPHLEDEPPRVPDVGGVGEASAGEGGISSMEGLPGSAGDAADRAGDPEDFSLEGASGSRHDTTDGQESEAGALGAGGEGELGTAEEPTDPAAGDAALGDRPSPEPGVPPGTAEEIGPDSGPGAHDTVDPTDEATSAGGGAGVEEPVPVAGDVVDAGLRPEISGLEDSRRPRRRRRRVRQVVVAFLGALIVAAGGGAAAAYLGFIQLPDITLPDITLPEWLRSIAPPPTEPPTEPPEPTAETPVISHVLTVDAWRDIETALSTVRALQERLPKLLFFVTVREIDGADQYALLAGPAYSAMEAEGLKEPVAAVLGGIDPATWTVQEARYSFLLGEYSEAVAADGRVQSLAALAIPAHVLQLSYPGGTTRLRVYGGAFADESQAAAMGRLLRANGLSDVGLTERRGRTPE